MNFILLSTAGCLASVALACHFELRRRARILKIRDRIMRRIYA